MKDSTDRMEFERGNPQEEAPRRVQRRKRPELKPIWFAAVAVALLAALAVCGIGILFSILIVLGMDIYRKHTYTSVILPDAYRITDMKATAHTSYSVNGSNTDYVYIITVKYEIDGTSYTDTLQILQGTHFATELHARYLADNAPEEVLGNLYYSEKDPSHIGRYGDDSLFVE